MNLKLNGADYTAKESMTLEALIHVKNFKSRPFVVELNGKVVDRTQYPTIVLKENDRVEIVTFVGGG